jgi:hypothetical protein
LTEIVTERLFDDQFLKKLEYLYLISKKMFAGKTHAQSRSKKIGWGMEFADHRTYNPGDDLRTLDWNLYGRVGVFFTKLFHEEENLSIHFLLDVSRSMDFGDPRKLDYAKRVVAALAYVGLANLDTVNIHPFADDLGAGLTSVRGKGRILKVFEYLEALPAAAATTDLARSLRSFAVRTKGKGLAVIVSDFYDERGYQPGMKLLFASGFDLQALQVHHPREAEPKYRGTVHYVDAETGEHRIVAVNRKTLARYRAEYAAYNEEFRRFCNTVQCHSLHALTRVPFEDLILKVFRQGRFVK